MLDNGSNEEFVLNSEGNYCAPFNQQCNMHIAIRILNQVFTNVFK